MSLDDRVEPKDDDAERAVLGAMLTTRDAIAQVAEKGLRAADFYRPQHEELFDLLMERFASGDDTDVVSMLNAATRARINFPEGPLYLHTLVASAPITANAASWADSVIDKAHRRRLITAHRRGIQTAYDAETAADAQDASEAAVQEAEPDSVSHDYVPLGDLFSDLIDTAQAMSAGEVEAFQFTPTGFLDLDDLFGGGLTPGQMVVVAGRPATGKSTLAVDFLRHASIHYGHTSAIFSLEMTRQELALRVMSAESKVALQKLRTGDLNDYDWDRIAGAMRRGIQDAPLFIDDSANMTMTEIRAKARRLKHDHDLRLIVIDYMQLMSSGKRVESRQLEVSEFSRQIKLLAKELEVPVVALSQLNRGVEQRSTKRPLLSDLRESGSIEQDADIVILVHREDLYEQESSRPGEADLIVAKHRNGATRDIVVAAQLHFARFTDLAHNV